jgi:Ran GTPase-activating protein (RanGAP) involved in mRNA processing and transport
LIRFREKLEKEQELAATAAEAGMDTETQNSEQDESSYYASKPHPSVTFSSSSKQLVSSGMAVMSGGPSNLMRTPSGRMSISPPPMNRPGSRAKGVQQLSNTEKETYFGEDARNSFFGYYRQLSRQQHLFSSKSVDMVDGAAGLDISAAGLSALLDDRVDSTALGGGYGLGVSSRSIDVKKTQGERTQLQIHEGIKSKFGEHLERTDIHKSKTANSGGFRSLSLSVDSDDETHSNGSDSPLPPREEFMMSGASVPRTSPSQLSNPDSSALATRLDAMRQKTRKYGSKSKQSPTRSVPSSAAATPVPDPDSDLAADLRFDRLMDELELHAEQQLFEQPQNPKSRNPVDNTILSVAPRPLSARSRFLISCVASNIKPDPSLVVRRHMTAELNISSKSIGDKMARVLASALPTLPMLEVLKLAANRLTDSGLTHIIDVLANCPRLTSLDISQNKVDSLGARSLAAYLSHSKCLLADLVLRQADIDDLEAANFINALSVNNSVTYLDMSRNLLGSHELRTERYTNPDQFITGAVALGKYLSTPKCSIKTLILSWNMIRLQSCTSLVQSLAFNMSLTQLDLSYNGLGSEGGEVLGDSLHSQRSLQYLNIAHNNIQPRAAFVIMCGVRSCETLQHVDISENPIGEIGGRAVMTLNLALGDAINIEIKGCSLRIKDKSCWFDPKKPPKDLKLSLSNYYERAICIEMLRLIAENDDLTVTKCRLTVDKATGPRDLEFVTRRVQRTRIGSSSSLVSTKNGAASIKVQGPDVESARRLFRQYDEDGNGSLDRHELSHLLKGLGLTDSKEAVDQMLAVYDIEGSGVIEEAEFTQFLTTMQETASKAAKQANERRYLMLKEDAAAISVQPPVGSPLMLGSLRPSSKEASSAPSSSSGRRPSSLGREASSIVRETPYLPPNVGTIDITVRLQNAASLFMQTATSGNVMSVIQASKALADSTAMIDCALASMNLKFDEAMVLYRIMIKEVGDRAKVLLQLLPRVATPADARRLYNKTSQGDLEEKLAFRAMAGKLYDVYMRVPSGYYAFNLADSVDHSLLHRFVDIHKANIHERQRLDYADTSEHGDWLCNFRNVILDGQPFVLTDEWLDHVPNQGHLHFDFVPLNRISQAEQAMSDVRFLNLLIGLGLLQEDQRPHSQSRLQMLDEMGRMTAHGVGVTSGNEMNLTDTEEMMIQVDTLRTRLADRANVVDGVREERELERMAYFSKFIKKEGEGNTGTKAARATIAVASTPVPANQQGNTEKPAEAATTAATATTDTVHTTHHVNLTAPIDHSIHSGKADLQ